MGVRSAGAWSSAASARGIHRGAWTRRRAGGPHRAVGARVEIAARKRGAAGEESGSARRCHRSGGREGNLERGCGSDLPEVPRRRRAPDEGRRYVGRHQVTPQRAKGLGLRALALTLLLLALSPRAIAADLPTLSDDPV